MISNMEQNQNSKIQNLLKELALLEQTFINNVATPSDLQTIKQLTAELYLLADLSLIEKVDIPTPKVAEEIPVMRQINDFYNPVDMAEDHDEIESLPEIPQESAPASVIDDMVDKTADIVESEVEIAPEVEPVEPPIVLKQESEKVFTPEISPVTSEIQFSKLLPLSKKFEYTRGLFGGDGSKLESFLKEAATLESKSAAKNWFNNRIVANGWANKPDMCEEFLVFMQRHLP